MSIIILTRYMFWTDLGVTAQIERAFLDGSERRVIINTGLSQPVGITIDYGDQRIYWSDIDLDRLEYSSFDGSGRSVVETEASGLLHPFVLTVANDLLFWTDWVTNSVYATHKVHGSNDTIGYFAMVATFLSDPYGIEALLENRQQQGIAAIVTPYVVLWVAIFMLFTANNSCENSSCTHICLLSGANDEGYVCMCPEGYRLEPDMVTCKGTNTSTKMDGSTT